MSGSSFTTYASLGAVAGDRCSRQLTFGSESASASNISSDGTVAVRWAKNSGTSTSCLSMREAGRQKVSRAG
jgi:hypothetical protein